MKKTITESQWKKQVAQGDVVLRRIEILPNRGTTEVMPVDGKLVLAHSETGHHHAIALAVPGAATLYKVNGAGPADPLQCYLVVDADFVDLGHAKTGPHAHGTIRVPKGTYEVRRAREWNPWTRSDRRVQD